MMKIAPASLSRVPKTFAPQRFGVHRLPLASQRAVHRRDCSALVTTTKAVSSKATSFAQRPRRVETKSVSDIKKRQSEKPPVIKSAAQRWNHGAAPLRNRTAITLDGEPKNFSPILLRDLCKCPSCVHESTRQKLYSTADIPADVQPRSVEYGNASNTVEIQWQNDVPGFEKDHKTTLDVETLRQIKTSGSPPSPASGSVVRHELWSADSRKLPDFEYQRYLNDDATVYEVVKQLKTHGLVFITGVPGTDQGIVDVGERIGPIRDTFYGRTWDVRTVPQAINAAYTSGDLGFHTDLLYFQDPPHLQLLHCIQSSSTGGASVFADAFKAACDLFEKDQEAFNLLANTPVTYHYEHPDANLYTATKPVFDTRPLVIGDETYKTLSDFLQAWESNRQKVRRSHDTELPPLSVGDCLEKINWGPPFLAPFSLDSQSMEHSRHLTADSPSSALSDKMDAWHSAAAKFSARLNDPENLHERLMQPGECVIFDNTRALHARRAFDSGDVGKPRWLKGTYVEKDPYWSKYRVLRHKLDNS